MADWTVNANDALHLSLVRANKDKEVLSDNESYENFHPTFTYPSVYEYSDLVIGLRFASGSLTQFLDNRYSSKLPSSSTLDDVRGTLEKFIPEGPYPTEAEFLARVEEDAVSFRPPGEKIYSYTRVAPNSATKGKGAAVTLLEGDPDAIVYEARWNIPGFREYHRRMQLFNSTLHRGRFLHQRLNEEEDSWEFAVLWDTPHYIPSTASQTRSVRLRLSQFVILPPYQHQGHGCQYTTCVLSVSALTLPLPFLIATALYKAIYEYVLTKPAVAELTVEDPAEAFEDLRDRNDLAMLLSHAAFMSEGFGADAVSHGGGRVSRARTSRKRGARQRQRRQRRRGESSVRRRIARGWRALERKELKIAGRQFHRLVEMLIQLHLNPADTRAAKAYRLQVKERLYRINYEVLAQLEEKERSV
ncbi:acyl-CoA N-acyltransferase [Russula brevipes]|nr:acyl-CoA N-acyltransferase [Russula brevipes]